MLFTSLTAVFIPQSHVYLVETMYLQRFTEHKMCNKFFLKECVLCLALQRGKKQVKSNVIKFLWVSYNL